MSETVPVAQKDLDSFKLVAAAILPTALVAIPITMQPAFVQGMVDFRGVDEVRAGFTASLEVLGLMAGTIIFAFIASVVNWRQVFASGITAVIAANMLTLSIDHPDVLMVGRLLAGLGAGAITAVGFATLAQTARPGRSFGLLVAMVMAVSALGFAVLPQIFALGGYTAFLVIYSLFLALSLPLSLTIGSHRAASRKEGSLGNQLRELLTGSNLFALLSVLAFFIGFAGAWTYMSLVARDGGLVDDYIASALSISQFFGVAGALSIAFLADRFDHMKLAIAIFGAGALAIFSLTHIHSYSAFLTMNAIYQFGWNAGQPLLLTIIAKKQNTESLLRFAIPLQFIGMGLAPSLAATILEISGGYALVVNASAAGVLLSLALIMPIIRNSK